MSVLLLVAAVHVCRCHQPAAGFCSVEQFRQLLAAALTRSQAVPAARLALRLEPLTETDGAGAAVRSGLDTLHQLEQLTELLPALNTSLQDISGRLAGIEAHLQATAECRDAAGLTEPSQKCILHPSPASDAEKAALPACARTCLQLRNQGGQHEDGVYWLSGMDVPVYCDFSHDEGGWTLLLTTASKEGWDILKVLERNPQKPSLNDNYSILRRADYIKDQGRTRRFAYRIEGQAETGRQRWGGIWLAPRHYTFTSGKPTQTEVILARKFDAWNYGDKSFEARMPWIRDGKRHPAYLLTTSNEDDHLWGTLVTNAHHWTYNPWVHGSAAEQSGKVHYWLREEEL